MTLRDRVPLLARALVLAAREHGQPNRFSPSWLYHENDAPSPPFQGLIAKDQMLMFALVDELTKLGWKGTKPVYADRTWFV